MKKQLKSPIKGKPLRYAGQSLDDEIRKLVNEDAEPYLISSLFITVLAGYEWFRFYKQVQPLPEMFTFCAILVVSFSAYKVRKILKKVKAYKLGRDGEMVVGQYLDDLKEKGYRVFHDLIGEEFNLDHVIVSQKGIYGRT